MIYIVLMESFCSLMCLTIGTQNVQIDVVILMSFWYRPSTKIILIDIHWSWVTVSSRIYGTGCMGLRNASNINLNRIYWPNLNLHSTDMAWWLNLGHVEN